MLFCSILYNLSQMGFHIKVIVTFFLPFPFLHVYLCLYKYKGAINSFFLFNCRYERLLYFILDERWTRARIRDGTLIHLSVFLFTNAMVIFTASQNDSRTEKYLFQRIVVIFAVLSYILYPLFHFYYMNLYYLLNFRLWKTHI